MADLPCQTEFVISGRAARKSGEGKIKQAVKVKIIRDSGKQPHRHYINSFLKSQKPTTANYISNKLKLADRVEQAIDTLLKAGKFVEIKNETVDTCTCRYKADTPTASTSVNKQPLVKIITIEQPLKEIIIKLKQGGPEGVSRILRRYNVDREFEKKHKTDGSVEESKETTEVTPARPSAFSIIPLDTKLQLHGGPNLGLFSGMPCARAALIAQKLKEPVNSKSSATANSKDTKIKDEPEWVSWDMEEEVWSIIEKLLAEMNVTAEQVDNMNFVEDSLSDSTTSDIMENDGNKPYKICDMNRNKKKGIVALSLEDLLAKVPEKLGLPSEIRAENLTVVLESDGTEVDDEEYFSTLDPDTSLMILHGNEKWAPKMPKRQVSLDQTDNVDLRDKHQVANLVGRLQHNLCHISLLGEQDLELLADMDLDSLAVIATDRDNRIFLEHIKEGSGRILLEKRQAQDAMELLKLYHQSVSNGMADVIPPQRESVY